MSMAANQWAPVKYATTRLGGGVTAQGIAFPGGLDLTTPSLALQPGALRDCINFECAPSGGYSRIEGYERFDGRPSPSAATYKIVQINAFSNTPSTGTTVTQTGTGATGVVIATSSGATPYLVLTKVTGTFNESGAITAPGPVAVGTAVATTVSVTSQQAAQYTAAAADQYRNDIGAVPGSGSILGVVAMTFSNVDYVYAFRANAGGTAVDIYKSSAAGWVQVPLLKIIEFINGGEPPNQDLTIASGETIILSNELVITGTVTVQGTLRIQSGNAIEPADGDTLMQGSVSATIKRVMHRSGTWNAGTAAGGFVITNVTGGNFVTGAASTSSGAVVILNGTESNITISVGGKFEFVKCNFSGQTSTRRIYGIDGVNKAFEFDGETYAPITTGNSPDQPTHIAFHKNLLFLSQSSSVFYSAAGTPFKWSSVDGAGEIATGDVVTGMVTLPGSQSTATLGIFLRGNTSFLYGTDPASFNYVAFNTGQGALPYSAQNLFDTFVFDSMGVITLKTTLNFGNFLPTTLTKNILPFILQQRNKLCASAIQRAKSQYRVFFNDGYGLWLTVINQQYLGAGVVLYPDPVYCCDYGESSNGDEVAYFGSNDGAGYIYQFDKGTSFDGAAIDAHITLAWDPIKSPRVLKRFRAGSIEIQGTGYASVQFGYQLGYGTTLIGQPTAVSYASGFRPAPAWDSFVWDNFFWDGQTLLPTDVDMTGTGENVQVTITSTTNYIPAYTVNSVIYHYTPRRGIRV